MSIAVLVAVGVGEVGSVAEGGAIGSLDGVAVARGFGLAFVSRGVKVGRGVRVAVMLGRAGVFGVVHAARASAAPLRTRRRIFDLDIAST